MNLGKRKGVWGKSPAAGDWVALSGRSSLTLFVWRPFVGSTPIFWATRTYRAVSGPLTDGSTWASWPIQLRSARQCGKRRNRQRNNKWDVVVSKFFRITGGIKWS